MQVLESILTQKEKTERLKRRNQRDKSNVNKSNNDSLRKCLKKANNTSFRLKLLIFKTQFFTIPF